MSSSDEALSVFRKWKERGTCLSLFVMSTDTRPGFTADILQVGEKKIFFGVETETRSFELRGCLFTAGSDPPSIEVKFMSGDRLLFVERKAN